LANTACFLKYLGGLSLTFEYGSLFDTFSDIDLGLSFTLGVEYFRSFDSLALSLELHTSPDLFRRLDVLDLIAHALDAPLLGGLVKCALDIFIEGLTLLECAVQFYSANLTAHRGLSKEADCANRLVHLI
jgi:hypothetical protein